MTKGKRKVCIVVVPTDPPPRCRASKLGRIAKSRPLLPLNRHPQIRLATPHNLLKRLVGKVPQHTRPSVLRDDDVVEVAGHLEAALLTVGPVPYAEALLHTRLPRPRVDGVPRPAVPLLPRARGCRRRVRLWRLCRRIHRRGRNVVVGAGMSGARIAMLFPALLVVPFKLHLVGGRGNGNRPGEPSGQLIRKTAIQHHAGRTEPAAPQRTEAIVRLADGRGKPPVPHRVPLGVRVQGAGNGARVEAGVLVAEVVDAVQLGAVADGRPGTGPRTAADLGGKAGLDGGGDATGDGGGYRLVVELAGHETVGIVGRRGHVHFHIHRVALQAQSVAAQRCRSSPREPPSLQIPAIRGGRRDGVRVAWRGVERDDGRIGPSLLVGIGGSGETFELVPFLDEVSMDSETRMPNMLLAACCPYLPVLGKARGAGEVKVVVFSCTLSRCRAKTRIEHGHGDQWIFHSVY
jgi:hypothetical protein